MKPLIDHLRNLSSKHRERVDNAITKAEKMKAVAQAAKEAAESAASEKAPPFPKP